MLFQVIDRIERNGVAFLQLVRIWTVRHLRDSLESRSVVLKHTTLSTINSLACADQLVVMVQLDRVATIVQVATYVINQLRVRCSNRIATYGH